jgi:hypothetical protein
MNAISASEKITIAITATIRPVIDAPSLAGRRIIDRRRVWFQHALDLVERVVNGLPPTIHVRVTARHRLLYYGTKSETEIGRRQDERYRSA